MENIGPIILGSAGLCIWTLAFLLYERRGRKQVERELRQLGAQRRLQGWIAMNERSRQARTPDGL